MTNLTNSAEGGSDGTTVTLGNSGGVSGNAFDVVNIGTGTTNVFDNVQAAHGGLSYEFASTGTSATCYNSWSTTMGTKTQIWFRGYYYLTGAPISDIRLFNVAGPCAAVWLSTGTTKLRFVDAAAAIIFTMATSIPYNQWFRIEGMVLSSTTVGQVELKQFNAMDSPTPTETQTSAASQVLTATMSEWRFGHTSALASVGPFWVDDMGLSDTGYLGPYAGQPSVPTFIRSGQSGLWR